MISRIDLHLHTTQYSADSIITPEQLLIDAKAAQLTGVVITEHDWLWSDEELAELNARPEATGLTVMAGVEVSAREGHFLCFGLPHLRDIEPGIYLKNLIEEVHGYGGVIVAAHPYRWDQDFDSIFNSYHHAISALELASKNVDTHSRTRVESLVKRRAWQPTTGSSDAHEPGQIGCYFTEFDTEIHEMKDFLNALKSGSIRARHNKSGEKWQQSGPISE
jgi:predicted metal-dependent phosphoesterase TrpH